MADFVLSMFDARVFLETPFSKGSAHTLSTELEDVLNFGGGNINKDIRTYKTLTGNGWDDVAALGQSIDDFTVNFIRKGEEVYTGPTGSYTSPYCVLKAWYENSLGAGQGANMAKDLVRIVPRGSGTYEGTVYHVIPKNFSDVQGSTDAGQEFSVTFTVFGAPLPGTVAKDASTGKFTITV